MESSAPLEKTKDKSYTWFPFARYSVVYNVIQFLQFNSIMAIMDLKIHMRNGERPYRAVLCVLWGSMSWFEEIHESAPEFRNFLAGIRFGIKSIGFGIKKISIRKKSRIRFCLDVGSCCTLCCILFHLELSSISQCIYWSEYRWKYCSNISKTEKNPRSNLTKDLVCNWDSVSVSRLMLLFDGSGFGFKKVLDWVSKKLL